MSKGKILIIDDEEKLRQLLTRIISLEGFQVFQASTATNGIAVLEQEKEILLVICDVKLPDLDGFFVLNKIKSKHLFCEIILLTAFGSIQDGVKAIKQGAFDYLTKGDDNDKIVLTVERAVEKAKMQFRIYELEKKLDKRYNFEQIIGISQKIKEALALARKVAPADSYVLLEGDTGTGKEVFAQSIHNASPRKNKPFVAVNCSAIAKDLLESEFFGHKKGAFTGANLDKKGLFEEANEGTLFLDEISELHLDLQSKMLRVLETQAFMRVGETKPISINVRIIAATNRNLQQEIETGHFRNDLYYRLSVFKIEIPRLNERKEDIEMLASHFLDFYSGKLNKRVTGMDEAFRKKLMVYNWKGNTRELKNIIERAVILAENDVLTADLLPFEENNIMGAGDQITLEELEKLHIGKILSMVKGNKNKAAEILGIGLTTLYRKIELYQLDVSGS